MTRRFALTSPPDIVRAHFGYEETPDYPPRREIKPGEPIAIVVPREFTRGETRHFRLMRWGFLPGFADPAEFPLIANARAETVMEKPSFAAAFRRRRALIPADAFPLPRGRGMAAAADGAPLAFAALHETFLDPNGSEIDTACVLTVAANVALAPFGERMPALIARADFARWLDHETTSLAAAAALLAPAPEAALRLVMVR
jgi:putative SOS response-associated peptidase YedK